MKFNVFFLTLSFYIMFSSPDFLPAACAQQTWTPQEDPVYLQEVSVKVSSEKPVTSIAVSERKCFAVISGEIFSPEDGQLIRQATAPKEVQKLFKQQNRIWAAAAGGLYEYHNKNWVKRDERNYVDMCTHSGGIHAATENEVYRLEGEKFVSIKPESGYRSNSITNLMEDGSQVYVHPVKLGPISKMASYSGTLYLLRRGEIILFDGSSVDEDFIDWGRLPSRETNDIIAFGNRTYIGTKRGLAELRGAALTDIRGKDGLPVEATSCLAPGFDHDLWIGTERGAIRMTKEGDFHYFSAGKWLPGQRVYSISADDHSVYIATDKGIGIIRYEPFTLQKKADWFEKHVEDWGYRRLGFIQYAYKKDGEWIREITDNDGSHTSVYLTAMCYKYAVTRDESDRQKAVDAFKSMLWLHKITGRKGFIARSIWAVNGDADDMSLSGSGGLPAKWYETPDGKWFWKGDTSSDEVTSHFYAVSLFHDLVARGKEKEEARNHIRDMAAYIIDCNWTMHDMDGKPTRWARWNPEYLLRPYGYMDRGLNGLEALSYMRAASVLTGGEQKFEDGYQQLVDWGYPKNTIRQKNTFPPEDIAPWDDDLAFMSYYTLLKYEKDPVLRSVYLRSLERTWAVKRIDQFPWFNFVYSALTENDGDFEKTMKFMREWTLDPRNHSFYNAHRDDLFVEKGYTSYDGTVKIFSPREVYIGLDGRRPANIDNSSNGNDVKPPVAYIRSYWMGRYYGFIKPAAADAPQRISSAENYVDEPGPTSYKGNPRPEVY